MAWIYRNQTEWIISLSSDGTTRITIADKNLWATQVYNSWDTLSEDNAWKYYQRGNNYGFSFTWTATTSSTQVNASNYWPWNYYSSSAFITTNPRDNSDNANLWGATTWTNEAMKWPCDSWYHIPTNIEFNNLLNIWYNLWAWSLSTDGDSIKNLLKLPYCWVKNRQYGTSDAQWTAWYYWTSESISSSNSYCYEILSSLSHITNFEKCWGMAIRPFKNEAVEPDRTWNKLYGDDILPPFLKWFIKNWNYYYFGDAPIHISWLALNKSSISLTTVWQTEQLTATISPQWAVETKVVWSSSDESIATVSQTWLVTCVTPWDATITATCGGYSASCSVIQRKDVYADFLLIGWGWAGGWCYNNATRWWGWGAWWFVERFNCLINAWTYNVVIWAWWNGWESTMACLYGCPSCFGNIVAYWWWGWWWYNIAGCWASWWWWDAGRVAWCAIHWNQWCNGWAWVYYAWWGWWWAKSVWSAWVCNSATCCWGAWWSGKCSCISWEWQRYSWWWWWAWWRVGWCWWCWWGWNWATSATWCGCSATYYGWWWGGWFNRTYSLWSWCQWVFIIRYPTACWHNITWWIKYVCWDYTIHCFTSNWTLTVN